MKSERRLEVEEYAEAQVSAAATQVEAFVAIAEVFVVGVAEADKAHMGNKIDVFAQAHFDAGLDTNLPSVLGVAAIAITNFYFV